MNNMRGSGGRGSPSLISVQLIYNDAPTVPKFDNITILRELKQNFNSPNLCGDDFLSYNEQELLCS